MAVPLEVHLRGVRLPGERDVEQTDTVSLSLAFTCDIDKSSPNNSRGGSLTMSTRVGSWLLGDPAVERSAAKYRSSQRFEGH